MLVGDFTKAFTAVDLTFVIWTVSRIERLGMCFLFIPHFGNGSVQHFSISCIGFVTFARLKRMATREFRACLHKNEIFLEKKKEGKDISVGNVVKEVIADGAQSSAIPRGHKRKSSEPEDSLKVLFGFDLASAPRVKGNLKKQTGLHGFVVGGSSKSAWSDRFSYTAFSEKVAQSSKTFNC
ncbi:hypothetical protein HN51_000945 [Arachis hypogaea]